MGTEVRIIEDSISELGFRLTTFRLRYPRIIHAEFMTHRIFSRNASSSRAIPVKRLASATADDMFIPKFRKNKPGMQPGAPLSDYEQEVAKRAWMEAADVCLRAAQNLEALGVHKQWANRMLEWFGYINVVVTASTYENFFALRRERDENGLPMAQDEMYDLANEMERQYQISNPKLLKEGTWHLPFLDHEDLELIGQRIKGQYEFFHDALPAYVDTLCAVSSARCARVSYYTVEGKRPSIEEDIALYKKLEPVRHVSPMEHQATPDYMLWNGQWAKPQYHGNFEGWIQHRKMIPGESGVGDDG